MVVTSSESTTERCLYAYEMRFILSNVSIYSVSYVYPLIDWLVRFACVWLVYAETPEHRLYAHDTSRRGE